MQHSQLVLLLCMLVSRQRPQLRIQFLPIFRKRSGRPPVNNYGARFFQKKCNSAAARRFFHIARLYMHGVRYESARLFFYISHAMRNKSVGFESTRVFMHGA